MIHDPVLAIPLAAAGLAADSAGMLLILLAIALLLADLHIGARGTVAVTGAVSLVAGVVLIAGGAGALAALSIWLAIVALAAVGLGTIGVLAALQRNRRHASVVGEQTLLGREAIVRTSLHPTGYVSIDGETWKATLVEGTAEPGESVTILDVHGLELTVWRTRPPARYYGDRRRDSAASEGKE